MLKFLTHKLRTHSINEENYNEKVIVGFYICKKRVLTSI